MENFCLKCSGAKSEIASYLPHCKAHKVNLATRSQEFCNSFSIRTPLLTISILSANFMLKVAETSAKLTALKSSTS